MSEYQYCEMGVKTSVLSRLIRLSYLTVGVCHERRH